MRPVSCDNMFYRSIFGGTAVSDPKTYLPGFYKAMKDLQKYQSKWAAPLGVSMTPQQATCAAALANALAACLPLFIPPPPVE